MKMAYWCCGFAFTTQWSPVAEELAHKSAKRLETDASKLITDPTMAAPCHLAQVSVALPRYHIPRKTLP